MYIKKDYLLYKRESRKVEMQLMRKVNRISAPTAAAQRSKHEAGIQIKTAKPDQTNIFFKLVCKLQDMLVRSV